MTKKEHK